MRSDNIKFVDIFWNAIGSITYAAVSMLLSIVVINIVGKIEGGIFSFGFGTLAKYVFIIAYFGIRPMHIVDIKYRYSLNDYLKFGVGASIVGVIIGLLYILYMLLKGNYTEVKFVILLLLILHGGIDGFADYYECEYQRVNKLYMGGQSQFFRIVVFTIALIVTLVLTENLILAESVALIAEILSFYILNIKRSKNIFKNAKLNDIKTSTRNLFTEAFPLFIIVFLDAIIFMITKVSIDANLGDVISGFFSLLFMPANLIFLIINLFMKPFLTPLSNAYYTSKFDYRNLLAKAMLVALVVSIISIVATIFLGDYYFKLINFVTGSAYPEFADIADKLLLLIIIGGCFYAINSPLYYSLIIENKQKYLVISYVITAVLAVFVTKIFIMNLGLEGAAYAFLINMFALCTGVIITKGLTA